MTVDNLSHALCYLPPALAVQVCLLKAFDRLSVFETGLTRARHEPVTGATLSTRLVGLRRSLVRTLRGARRRVPEELPLGKHSAPAPGGHGSSIAAKPCTFSQAITLSCETLKRWRGEVSNRKHLDLTSAAQVVPFATWHNLSRQPDYNLTDRVVLLFGVLGLRSEPPTTIVGLKLIFGGFRPPDLLMPRPSCAPTLISPRYGGGFRSDQPSSSKVPHNEVVRGNTRYTANVATKETGRTAFIADELRVEAAGGNSQMGRTYTDEENVAMDLPTPKRGRRAFTRYLLAIGIGVAATLAWQSYGATTKQIIAARAPQLGWSPQAKQMIASWVRQLGWTPDAPQPALAAQTAPATAAPMAASPALDLQQVQQIARDLAKVRQAVEQLAASQGRVARDIANLQAADQEILQTISAPRPRSATVPAHIPMPVGQPPIPN